MPPDASQSNHGESIWTDAVKMVIYKATEEFNMTAITFDTLAYSNKLQKAGMPREQADAMAKAQAEAMKEIVAAQELVTKHDLYIALSETKHEILKWMMGMFVAQAALIVAVIAFIK